MVGWKRNFRLQMGKRASAQHEKQRFRVRVEPNDPVDPCRLSHAPRTSPSRSSRSRSSTRRPRGRCSRRRRRASRRRAARLRRAAWPCPASRLLRRLRRQRLARAAAASSAAAASRKVRASARAGLCPRRQTRGPGGDPARRARQQPLRRPCLPPRVERIELDDATAAAATAIASTADPRRQQRGLPRAVGSGCGCRPRALAAEAAAERKEVDGVRPSSSSSASDRDAHTAEPGHPAAARGGPARRTQLGAPGLIGSRVSRGVGRDGRAEPRPLEARLLTHESSGGTETRRGGEKSEPHPHLTSPHLTPHPHPNADGAEARRRGGGERLCSASREQRESSASRRRGEVSSRGDEWTGSRRVRHAHTHGHGHGHGHGRRT